MIARDGGGILPDGTAHPDVTAALARRKGYGEPLDEGLRADLSTKLGDSFHDVRVHTDAEAGELARSVSANAFTTGSDVYFGHEQYKPDSPEGKELIAHELAHVVQQRGAPTTGPMRVSQPGEPLERRGRAGCPWRRLGPPGAARASSRSSSRLYARRSSASPPAIPARSIRSAGSTSRTSRRFGSPARATPPSWTPASTRPARSSG